MTPSERLRDPGPPMTLRERGEIADELDRLAAEVSALRQERDALAATQMALQLLVEEIYAHDDQHRHACADLLGRINTNPAAVLAARDAQTRADERERCAKVCERDRAALNAQWEVWSESPALTPEQSYIDGLESDARCGEEYAAAIRAIEKEAGK